MKHVWKNFKSKVGTRVCEWVACKGCGELAKRDQSNAGAECTGKPIDEQRCGPK